MMRFICRDDLALRRPVALGAAESKSSDDAHVGGDRAVLGGEDRIEVELGDLGEIG